jgi:hypothetical protein
MMPDVTLERRRAALATLSTVGAAMAGVGVGILASAALSSLAWPILAVGIAIHLFGMVGTRRVVSSTGYQPAKWEQAAYWLCWAAILLVGLFVLWRVLQ